MVITRVVLCGRRLLLCSFILLQFWTTGLPAQAVTIHGQIFSKSTGDAIGGVIVFAKGNKTDTGTVADKNGKYAIILPAQDSVLLQFSAENYKSLSLALSIKNKKV